jgi:hypothetical protein
MKCLVFAFALLSSSTLLAQNSQGTPTDAPLTQQTVRGCLQIISEDFSLSGNSGMYELDTDNGTTYRLEGDSAKLKESLGHEIDVAGTIGNSAVASSSSTAKDSSQRTIQFVDVKDLSITCKSSK